jgi:transcription antitermination factor NusG
VAELLEKECVTTYCPLNRVLKQWSDRKKLVYEPLFTCYVFVQVGASEMQKVKSINGVINFVCWLGKPANIKDEEIEIIRRFLKEHINVRLEKTEINVNDVVRITNGAFMESEGSIVSVYGKKVKICLPTLGYTLVAEIEKTTFELVRKAGSV